MSAIPEHIARAAVDDMIDGLYERCGIKRVGSERTFGGVDAWLSWGDQQHALERWADDGGRA